MLLLEPCISLIYAKKPTNTTITQLNKKVFFLVPWFLGLFLGLFGALIQKNALDKPHQLSFLDMVEFIKF
jgi:hypothetical protein